MKILIGVDTDGEAQIAADMVLKLKFPQPEVDLVHVVASVFPDGGFPELSDEHPVQVIMNEWRRAGQAALDAVKLRLEGAGVRCRTFLTQGDPVQALLDHADREKCELLAIHSKAKGYYNSLFLGSIAKGLIIGAKASVLIVKGSGPANPDLRAVVATDHSAYFASCADLLLRMAPAGFKELTVMTANEVKMNFAGWGRPELIISLAEGGEWSDEAVHARNQSLLAKLLPLCPNIVSEVVEAHPNEAIKKTMEATKSDLLVLGAQGHGFVERVMLGSKSFHQVVNEPFSVLVLRA